jgi:phospholipase C
VKGGKLPQVSWIVAPAGYTEHSDWPINYGAWYISQILDILVSSPGVFSKTVLIINYDEADGSFDHIVPPSPPPTPATGASTVTIQNEIVTTSTPNGPIGLGTRVPFLAISPWSKGGYVNSQVFDHTSTIQFIEKRFGVVERNITPWRRAVAGDLTSVFNFENPNGAPASLPGTSGYLPSTAELAGGGVNTFQPTLSSAIIGVPAQEKGIRPARALPYLLGVRASVHTSNSTVSLTFFNTGRAAAVFQVRSGNPADAVRFYTVEPGKNLSGTWNAGSSYDLSVLRTQWLRTLLQWRHRLRRRGPRCSRQLGRRGRGRHPVGDYQPGRKFRRSQRTRCLLWPRELTASTAPGRLRRPVVTRAVPWLVRLHRHGCRRPGFQIPVCGSRRKRTG